MLVSQGLIDFPWPKFDSTITNNGIPFLLCAAFIQLGKFARKGICGLFDKRRLIFLNLDYCKQCCKEHERIYNFGIHISFSLGIYSIVEITYQMEISFILCVSILFLVYIYNKCYIICINFCV